LLRPLYGSRAALRILDAGCGLGFLTYVAAKPFPKASITGVNLFRHASVSKLSIEMPTENMKALGLDSRTSFVKHDLAKPLRVKVRYHLALSNVVLHNMGRKRFDAYGTSFEVLKSGGYFVVADWFQHQKSDMEYLRQWAALVDEVEASELGFRITK
jgi:16S rRNA G1207 methylase RsmC